MLFNKKAKKETITDLDNELENLTIAMMTMDKSSDAYAKTVDQYVKLKEVKSKYENKTINPEVILTTAANIAGILLILNYEKAGAVTSKAISFIRGRG